MNSAEAVKWYRKAAEQGFAAAQYDLGRMYFKGEVVPRDYTEAAKWYRKLAEQDAAAAQYDTAAQYELGGMYFRGQGVPRDYVIAYMWFSLAAAKGDKDARKMLDDLERKLTPEQIAEAQKLAREWKSTSPKP